MSDSIVYDLSQYISRFYFLCRGGISSLLRWQRPLLICLLFLTTRRVVFVDVPGTPSLLQVPVDDADDDQVQLVCRASITRSKPSQLAPDLQYLWIVDGQPVNDTDVNATNIIFVSRVAVAATYECITREAGSRLHSMPSNQLLIFSEPQLSSCSTCESLLTYTFISHNLWLFNVRVPIIITLRVKTNKMPQYLFNDNYYRYCRFSVSLIPKRIPLLKRTGWRTNERKAFEYTHRLNDKLIQIMKFITNTFLD